MSNSMRMLYKQLLLRTVFFRKRLDKFTRGTVFPSYSRSGWLEAETQNAWQWGQLYLVPLLAALCPPPCVSAPQKEGFQGSEVRIGVPALLKTCSWSQRKEKRDWAVGCHSNSLRSRPLSEVREWDHP